LGRRQAADAPEVAAQHVGRQAHRHLVVMHDGRQFAAGVDREGPRMGQAAGQQQDE